MKQSALTVTILMIFTVIVYGQPDESVPPPQDSLQVPEEIAFPPEDITADSVLNSPSSVLQEFFQALRTGDNLVISRLISKDGLEEIDTMLDVLKENLSDNEETTMSRLSAAGYTATADEMKHWSSTDYLSETVVLPMMQARYSSYDMQIEDYISNSNELVIPLLFITASGVELHYDAVLVKENDQWKVTNFMGLNSFP